MTDLPSACVIGARSSGIAAAKALHERGVPFDCFELSDRVGGNWVFENKEVTRRERAKMLRRYVASKRHTMQVDFDDYLHDLRRELRAGARRARARGFRLPVAARAAQPAVSPVRA